MEKKVLAVIGIVVIIACIGIYVFRPQKKAAITSTDPGKYYTAVTVLKAEAEALVRQKQWAAATAKYGQVMEALHEITVKFPGWEPEKLAADRNEYQDRLDLIVATSLNQHALDTFHARDYDKARLLYSEFIDKYGEKFARTPASAAAWYHLGYLDRLAGDYDKAAKEFQRVVDDYPEEEKYRDLVTKSRMGLLLIYQVQDRYEEADKLLEEMLSSDPQFSARLRTMFEVFPVRSWKQDLGASFPLVQEYMATFMAEKEFVEKMGAVTPGLKNEAFFFVGLKAYLANKPDAAKKSFERCLAGAADRESLGYKLSIAFMNKLSGESR